DGLPRRSSIILFNRFGRSGPPTRRPLPEPRSFSHHARGPLHRAVGLAASEARGLGLPLRSSRLRDALAPGCQAKRSSRGGDRPRPSSRGYPPMHLSELKALHVSELIKMGEALEIENVSRLRKQELMFAIMKKRAKAGEQVFGDGVLEVLPDGFGFLRSPDASYMASTDDI